MSQTLAINKNVATKIVNLTFMMSADELAGIPYGCIGMLNIASSHIDIVSFEPFGTNLQKEIESYLATAESKRRSDSPILMSGTPHSIRGVVLNETFFCFYSPFDGPSNLAVAVVYGYYHKLKEKMGIADEVFEDTLLLQLGEWQEKYAHDNEIIMPIAQTVFKPEILTVKIEFPGVHRY